MADFSYGYMTISSNNIGIGFIVSSATPTIAQVLTYDGNQWTPSAVSQGGGSTLIGDVTGTLGANSVTGLRGFQIDSSAPGTNTYLYYNGSKWVSSAANTVTTSLIGDVTGTNTINSVTAIRGFVVSPISPTTTQVLTYDGTKYVASGVISNVIGASGAVTLVNGSVISVGIQNAIGDVTGSITAGSVTAIRGNVFSPIVPTLSQAYEFDGSKFNALTRAGDVTGSLSALSVTGIRGIVVSTNAPTITQVLTYDGSKWTPSAITQGSGSTLIGDVTGTLAINSVTGIRGQVIDASNIAQNGNVLFYKGDKWTASAFAGDVTGSVTSMAVTGIRGVVVSPTAPTTTQVLTYDGSKYTPSGVISNVIGSSGLVTLVNGSVISVGIQNTVGDVTGSITANSVTGIRGVVVSPSAPTITQVLTYDGTKWTPSGTSTNPLTLAGDVTGASNSNSVTAIRGFVITPTSPANNQQLVYNSNSLQWSLSTLYSAITSTSANYTAISTGYIVNLISSGGNITVTLLAANNYANGFYYTFKDSSGSAQKNNIVISSSTTASKIDGAQLFTISANYGAVSLYNDGINWFTESTTVEGGDITGGPGYASVTGIRGIVVSPTAPTTTQVLTYDGNKYTPSGVVSNVIGSSGLVTLVNGSVISIGIQNAVGDVTGSLTANSVTAIRGVVVSPTAPTITQVLTYDGTKWTPSGTSTNPLTLLGDVTGTTNSNSVTAIRGIPVFATVPTIGQSYEFDGVQWKPWTQTGDVTGSVTAQSVTGIRGVPVSAAVDGNNVLVRTGTMYTGVPYPYIASTTNTNHVLVQSGAYSIGNVVQIVNLQISLSAGRNILLMGNMNLINGSTSARGLCADIINVNNNTSPLPGGVGLGVVYSSAGGQLSGLGNSISVLATTAASGGLSTFALRAHVAAGSLPTSAWNATLTCIQF